jgi:hypothetical protein
LLTQVRQHRLQQEDALDGNESTLQGEDIGLDAVADGIWDIDYYRTLLGQIDERSLLITGV